MDRLDVGAQLVPGQSLVSPDTRFNLTLQNDGNLVLYWGTIALWASDTGGKPAKNVIMQADGNLVIYSPAGPATWASNTAIHQGAYLILQNDGNAVIYLGTTALWATDTWGAGNFLVGKSPRPKYRAVEGDNTGGGDAVFGFALGQGRGVVGVSEAHTGVEGDSTSGVGVWGSSATAQGVVGRSDSWQGVYGHSNTQAGVVGESDTFDGVYGIAHNLQAAGVSGHNPGGLAGFFDGNVTVNGNITVSGDVLLTGADCAEQFEVIAGEAVEPGTVMVMTDQGQVTACSASYDRKVVGVVSGAGAYRPAIVMDRRDGSSRASIALIGKVFCKVDADGAPVKIGDLLTTSATPGHAMRVGDPGKSTGAILGKAMSSLERGRSLVPVLIALQ